MRKLKEKEVLLDGRETTQIIYFALHFIIATSEYIITLKFPDSETNNETTREKSTATLTL